MVIRSLEKVVVKVKWSGYDWVVLLDSEGKIKEIEGYGYIGLNKLRS